MGVTSGSTRNYGGASASARVEKRRSGLIDAALTEMAENRWRSATVASLCVQARLNKRYFYESFDDLDRLADAVIDSVAADVGGAAVAAYLATLDSPLEVQAKNTVSALVDVLGTDRRKALVLLGGVPTSAGQEDTRRAAIGGLTAILVDHARRIHDVELEQDSLAFTAPAFVIGGTAQTILSWVNGDLPVERDQLIDDIAAIWLSLGESASDMARSRLDARPGE
ncbi:TetR family transcriptional regulator [Williamsia muralis]|uniref:TetR family transcriptional regulator n=1 Tax=Williamsia marianensis TaxID=85044 RepID=A0A315S6N9_WILMA|nr:TetR family transcriptional regulator [Williamsia marianensis]RKR93603.1 TetR family transcriptional regulator [Williamsia muralis]